jgi:hypothetical protein
MVRAVETDQVGLVINKHFQIYGTFPDTVEIHQYLVDVV